ncbi:MAG TPA: hypothetical protein VKN63_04960 [Afifellaceae bacterium]|nr:hypothetical protein [Afifellaceae bacterium]
MKVQLLKNKKGKAIASINQSSEDANLVPLDVELEDGSELDELEMHPRDLLDIDRFYEVIKKTSKN